VPESNIEVHRHANEAFNSRDADVATPAAHVCRWQDGLIVYFKGYLQRQDAFRDLGVSEDARRPITP
jgi:protoporphyrinogen oxidase